jgi:hypothetical protein
MQGGSKSSDAAAAEAGAEELEDEDSALNTAEQSEHSDSCPIMSWWLETYHGKCRVDGRKAVGHELYIYLMYLPYPRQYTGYQNLGQMELCSSDLPLYHWNQGNPICEIHKARQFIAWQLS